MNQSRPLKSIFGSTLIIATSTILRAFLEFFSNPDPGGGIGAWYGTLNYFLCFLSIIAGIALITKLLLREPFGKSFARTASYSPIILLAPIIDLLLSRGQGFCMAYLGSSGALMVSDFFSFFGKLAHCGISPGMRIEILIILIGIGWLIWKKTSSVFSSILGVLLSYILIFINGAIPGIFGLFAHIGNSAGPWLASAIRSSMLWNIHSFVRNPNPTLLDAQGISLFTARIHFLETISIGLIAWLIESPIRFYTWFKNSRPERIAYYLLILVSGMVLGSWHHPFPTFWVDIIGFIVAGVVVVTNFWAAVVTNDIADTPIDNAINHHRPLQSNNFSESSYRILGITLLSTSFIGALLLNYSFFFFMLTFQLLAMMYSLRSIRWKKHFIPASLTLGAVATATLLAGYFIVSPDQSFLHLPLYGIMAFFLGISIVSNVKDLRSRKADAADGVTTLPVILGTKNANLLIAGLSILLIGILGIFLHKPYLLVVAGFFILITVISFTKKIPENLLFVALFISIIGAFFFL